MSQLADRLITELGASRIYRAPYSPIQRAFFPNLDVPGKDEEPLHVMRASDAAEVGLALRLANEVNEPIYVRQGTGQLALAMDSPFPPGCVVVDLRDMRHFRLHRESGYLEVGPSVTLEQSNQRLAGTGYRFPIAVEPVTWGGLVSVNLSGHLVDAVSGKPGELVLGLEVVLPQGQVIQTGTRALRKVVGPDLTHLFVGGQGLFGVITDIRLRLIPELSGHAYGFVAFPDLASLAAAVADVYAQPLPAPTLMELIGRDFAVSSGLDELCAPGPLLLVATEGLHEDEAVARWEILARRWSEVRGGQPGRLTPEDWTRAWQIREAPQHAFAGEYLIGEGLASPIDRLSNALAAIETLQTSAKQRWPGLETYLIGHIGSGTIHPAFSVPAAWDYQTRVNVTAWIQAEVLRIRLELGATVGEQGVFPAHAEWFAAYFGSTSMTALRSLKLALDPKDLLNRGRLPMA